MAELSPFQKEKEVHDRLLAFLKINKSGLTTTDIGKATKISRKTLEKHLQLLARENEIYMRQHGPTRVYYPHVYKTLKSEKLRYDDKIIWLNLIETERGRFLLIKKSRLKDGRWEFRSSFTIPADRIGEFYRFIGKFKK